MIMMPSGSENAISSALFAGISLIGFVLVVALVLMMWMDKR